jgi:hypothetical protein
MKRHTPSRRRAGLSVPAIALLALVLSACATAQTIRVRLLNAKNGKPIAKRYVSIQWKDNFEHTDLLTDSLGVAVFPIPSGANEFYLMGGGTEKEPYRTVYLDCGFQPKSFNLVTTVVKSGIVPKNQCGRASVVPKPGEIVFWGLPRAWWQPDFQ